MEDLLDVLRTHGWYLLSEPEHPDASPDPFALDGDGVVWAIARADIPAVVELDFPAFGPLGGPPSSLRDILWCHVVGRDLALYFMKRSKPAWRPTLLAFVRSLGRSVP
jgi:hypothetical protein